MTNLLIEHLQASAHDFRREADRCRTEGQQAEDPYLMGQAVAYLECATRLMGHAAAIQTAGQVEAGEHRHLEVVS